jgi:Ni/Fe-hydrogenase 1 B-type cytochrome subunit
MARVREEHTVQARLYHWIHLVSIVVLAFTGFYIRWSFPFFGVTMATMRFLHFTFMYIVLLNLVLRISYAFLAPGRDWHEFGIGAKQWRLLPGSLAYYLFLRKELPKGVGEYNPLQRLTYLAYAILLIAQGLTGFALYTSTAAYFNWLTVFLGGFANVRAWHYFITWLFVVLVSIHIYLSVFEEFDEFKYMILSIKPREANPKR